MAKWIPTELYKQMVASIPIACVDLIIIYKHKYLIVKRKQEPLANEWYLPGGRLRKGEDLPDASLRVAHGEVGLACNFIDGLGFYMGFYDKSPFDIPLHTVSFVTLLKADNNKVKLDKNHSAYTWLNEIESSDNRIKDFLNKVKEQGWF